MDATIKQLHGKQEGAEIGYNPKKPGRPSQTYHTYQMSGLLRCIDRLPKDKQPKLVRIPEPGSARIAQSIYRVDLWKVNTKW